MNAHIDVIAVLDRMLNQLSTSSSPHALREYTEAVAAVGDLILRAAAVRAVIDRSDRPLVGLARSNAASLLRTAVARCGVAP